MKVSSVSSIVRKSNTNNLVLTGSIALGLSLVVTGVVQLIAIIVLKPDAGFTPLAIGTPQFFTIAAVVIATIVYAVVRRSSGNPARLFERIGLIVLVLTLIPDLALLLSGSMPGTNIGTVGALIIMHLGVWAITVPTLTRPDKRA